MRSRYYVQCIKGRRAIVVDSHTGKEFAIDGVSYGEMPVTVADLGADLLNWLESNPPFAAKAWEDLDALPEEQGEGERNKTQHLGLPVPHNRG